MANFKEIRCVVCGKIFLSNRNANVCGAECRKVRKRKMTKEYHEQERQRKRTIKREKNLDSVIKEARLAGISYGKYVAIRDGYLKDH